MRILFLIVIFIIIQYFSKTDKCNLIPGIEAIEVTPLYYVSFIINTNEKEKILSIKDNRFLSKITDGSYCQSFTLDFYNESTYISSSATKKWLYHKNKQYDIKELPDKIPYFYVSFKKYSFYLDYENNISMDIYTNIVYEYKEKYPLHFNILTLSSPQRWKNLEYTQKLPFKVTDPIYSEYPWVKYFNENIR